MPRAHDNLIGMLANDIRQQQRVETHARDVVERLLVKSQPASLTRITFPSPSKRAKNKP